MAQLTLGIVGGVVGGFFGVPWVGATLGAMAGGFIDRAFLFPPEDRVTEGPRLSDLHVQISSYGAPIRWPWGRVRLGANVIWAADLREVRSEEEVDGGGVCGGGTSMETITYSYYGSFACLLCKGPIDAVTRIWADSFLIYNTLGDNEDVVAIEGLKFTVYEGTETQDPDPTIEAHEGSGNVPAYRGSAYIVFDDLPLERFGNRLPNISAEVVTSFTDTTPILPVPGLVNAIYNEFTMDPRGHQIVAQVSGEWARINILTREPEYERDTTGQNIPYLTQRFDVDEQGRIYTNKQGSANHSYFVRMTELMSVEATSPNEHWISTQYAVVRNPNYPWLYAVKFTGGGDLYLVNRETLIWGPEDYLEFSDPSGGSLVAKCVCVNHATGDAYVVWNAHAGGATTWLSRIDGSTQVMTSVNISSYCGYGYFVSYDRPTNQVLVGSQSGVGGDDGILFFDGDTLAHIATISQTVLVDNRYAPWVRGPINGIFYQVPSTIIYEIDVVNHEIKRSISFSPSWTPMGCGIYDPVTHGVFISAHTAADYSMYEILLDRGTPADVTLATIVSDICEEMGLEASEIDVSALTDLVTGFVIDNRMTARAAIQLLMGIYFFDGVESDGEIQFPKRGGSSVASIPESDLAAHPFGSPRPQELPQTRQMELELPQHVDVVYIDEDTPYVIGTQYQRRLVTDSDEKETYRAPVVLSADEAQAVADVRLYLAWLSRNRFKLQIPRGYAYLNPADVVTVTENGNVHTLRIDRAHNHGGLIVLEATAEDAPIYTSESSGVSLPDMDQDVAYEGPTRLYLMDVPLLESGQNRAGVYVAAAGYVDAWRGAVIFKSSDNGQTWTQWTAITKDAVVGEATDALGDVASPWVTDVGNTVNVRLADSDDSLSSVTEEQMLNGANVALLGDEVIQWQTATAETDGSYTLSNLLRGRRGTEWATGSHAIGDRFIVLSNAYITYVDLPIEEHNQARTYRAVSIGRNFSTGIDQSFTSLMRPLMPWSPQHVAGTRDGSNNLTITWVRRTRYNGEWRDSVGVPIGEDSEAYDVDVVEYDSLGNPTVLRTIETTSETASYTAAQQTADGLTPGDPVDVIIYQISADVDRGFGTAAQV